MNDERRDAILSELRHADARPAGDFGTEADGGASADYCVYCYKNGAFTEACTMEEMIRHCAGFHEEFRDENGKSYTREEAVKLMREYFPTLKRWSK